MTIWDVDSILQMKRRCFAILTNSMYRSCSTSVYLHFAVTGKDVLWFLCWGVGDETASIVADMDCRTAIKDETVLEGIHWSGIQSESCRQGCWKPAYHESCRLVRWAGLWVCLTSSFFLRLSLCNSLCNPGGSFLYQRLRSIISGIKLRLDFGIWGPALSPYGRNDVGALSIPVILAADALGFVAGALFIAFVWWILRLTLSLLLLFFLCLQLSAL